jgi:hypothetical protein
MPLLDAIRGVVILAVTCFRFRNIEVTEPTGDTGYSFESNSTVAGVTAGIRLPIYDRNQGA